MLSVCKVSCLRGNRLLFNDLSFNLFPQSWMLLEGPNGSGKSSFLQILAGLLPLEKGEIFWNGKLLKYSQPDYFLSMHYIGNKFGIQLSLSPAENLKWFLGIRGQPENNSCIKEILGQWNLKDFINIPCAHLSMGQRQRVALARLSLFPNLLWILDEPLSALDISAQSIFETHLQKHLMQGGMAIVASHSLCNLKIEPTWVLKLGNKMDE